MRRPAVRMAAGYAAGILLAALLHPPLDLALLLVLVALLPVLPRSKYRLPAFLLFLAALGFALFTARTTPRSPADLRLVLGAHQAIVTLRGTLCETPREKISNRTAFPGARSLANVQVTQVQFHDPPQPWQPAFGTVLVNTPGVLASNIFGGQAVEISGVINPPPLPVAAGLFNYRDYLATRGIYYELTTAGSNDWRLRPPLRPGPPWSDRFLQWSKNTMGLGLPVADEPLQLLWAMTLGWRTDFDTTISAPFIQAGTMHLFAIDGLRIALVSGIIITLLRVLGLSRLWSGAVIIPLIWFYTAATGCRIR